MNWKGVKKMMIKLRDLLNPLILNDGWVGFQGNSEYVLENGEVRMGYWTFLDIIDAGDAHKKDNFTLDDEIDESELLDDITWKVENDIGQLCVVQFTYNGNNDCYNSMLEVSSLITHIINQNICLDDYKSHYMHIAQDLRQNVKCNLCNGCDSAENSEEEIKQLSLDLINVRKEVSNRFFELMDSISQLDCELQYLIDENK